MVDRLEAARDLLYGIVKRFWIWIPAVFLDPFDIYNDVIRTWMPDSRQGKLDMPSEWFPFVAGILVFWAAALAFHELRIQGVVTSHVKTTMNGLKSKKIEYDDFLNERVSTDWAAIFREQAPKLAFGINENQLGENINIECHGGLDYEDSWKPIVAEWKLSGLVDTVYRDPAPGAPSAVRKSIHDLPYTWYTLTDHGKAVARSLEHQHLGSGGKRFIRKVFRRQ